MCTAVIVVHGVGDPLPGDALSGLVEGITGSTALRELDPRRIEYRIEPGDAATGSARVSTYPVHSAELQGTSAEGGQPVRLLMREVYWGDRSRVKGSAVALVYALFDLIFGLRHIVHAACEDAERIAEKAGEPSPSIIDWIRWCSTAALWMARGPMFALNILAASVCLAHVALAIVECEQIASSTVASVCRSASSPLSALFAGSLFTLVLGWWLRGRMARLHWSPDTAVSMVAVAVAALASALAFRLELRFDITTFIDLVTLEMSVGAVLMALFALVTLALCAIAVRSDSGELAVQKLRQPLVAVAFCVTMSLAMFVLVVIVGWLLFGQGIVKGPFAGPEATRVAGRIECGIHLFPLVASTFLAVVVVYAIVHFINIRMRGTRERHRYIVNGAVVRVFLVLSVVAGVAFVALAWLLESGGSCSLPVGGSGLIPAWFVQGLRSLEASKGLFISFAVPVVAALAASRAHFLSALDLVLDVIAHFRRDEGRGGQHGRQVQWESIIARFRDVVESAADDPRISRVVVVSHSQGTTIALQGLGLLNVGGHRLEPPARGRKAVALVTMGCPIDHLYRHYMPDRYAFDQDSPQRVAWWRNIFRIDDFIGTRISTVDETSKEDFPCNVAVGARGHTDYWRDREVLMHLGPLLLGTEGHCAGAAGVPTEELLPPVSCDGFSRRVLIRRRAQTERDPAVILMHELPGMTPACLALADRLAAQGFTVYLPLLFGEPGEDRMLRNVVRLCMEREFRQLALGSADMGVGLTTRWLRALSLRLHELHDRRGVGVVGMCLTGGFVLSMMLDRQVLAGVTCQPSMPGPFTRAMKRDVGLSQRDRDHLVSTLRGCPALLGVRFSGDAMSPSERFDALKDMLGERFERIDIPSGQGTIRPRAHATLTEEFREWDGHPTRIAFDRVVKFLKERLIQSDAA